MRFGVVLPVNGPKASASAIRMTAMAAEEAGFESVWATDHVLVGSGLPSYQTVFEALSVIGWIAGTTSRVRLGTSVLVLAQRNAVLSAKQLATLDVLSGGRLVVGVGAGYAEHEFELLGADFAGRGSRLDEAIAIMRLLWEGSGASFQGPTTTLSDYSFAPLPVQAGGPPIWVGGASEPALRRAGQLGDGWHASHLPSGAFADSWARVRELAGDRTVVPSVRLNLGAAKRDDRPPVLLGGGSDELQDDIAAYAEAGCEHMVINFADWDGPALTDKLWQFAEEVMPRFGASCTPTGRQR